jgi:2-oxoglutarate ferredoxin oxidoreductase subunit beta
MNRLMPKSWNEETKPHLFCPGCGHGIAFKQLGYAIDGLNIAKKTTLGIDIGCSLLAWNFLNLSTVQTHHGRTTPVMVGYKMMKPNRVAIAYTGDGGAYAIGLQSILHAAYRNDPVTVIVVNNENYAMTGGQMSPETMPGTVTSTTPLGKPENLGSGLMGPELIKNVASKNAFIARTSISNPILLQTMIKKAINTQIEKKSFSFVEILSICPTNWKTNAKTSFDILFDMEKHYPIGELK